MCKAFYWIRSVAGRQKQHQPRRIISVVLLAFLLASSACTSKKEDTEEVKYLRKKVSDSETEMAKYEEKIKAASADHGLQIKLQQDNELGKARLERLKEALKKAEARQKELE